MALAAQTTKMVAHNRGEGMYHRLRMPNAGGQCVRSRLPFRGLELAPWACLLE
jgi:hypothetical protein